MFDTPPESNAGVSSLTALKIYCVIFNYHYFGNKRVITVLTPHSGFFTFALA